MLCLVTDRRRLTTACDAAPDEWPRLLRTQVAAAAQAGVDLVQLREPDLEARLLARVARDLLDACRGTPTRLLINDRLDVAVAVGADGVHLRERSIASSLARTLIGASSVVTRAVHAADRVTSGGAVDCWIAGTVFPTVSKPTSIHFLGVDGLAAIVRAARSTPVLAIGGVDETTAAAVARAGVRGLASIGAFLPTTNDPDVTRSVQNRVIVLRRAFDTADHRP